MPYAVLTDRATLTVTGEAAETFLQNLLTSDLGELGNGEARPAALLTPQGKILFDFLVSRVDDGFRLDVAAGARADLLKRLTLYRLRAAVAVAMTQEPVQAIFAEAPGSWPIDRRFAGGTVFRHYGTPPETIAETGAEQFQALRVKAGIAEGVRDFASADVFPHDILLDLNGGVSFRKGCYVGQEVVSRMHHRGTARRRIMVLQGEGPLTAGEPILAGDRPVGSVLAAAGHDAMGLVRVDRVAKALAAGEVFTSNGHALHLSIPAWAGFTLPDATLPDEGGDA